MNHSIHIHDVRDNVDDEEEEEDTDEDVELYVSKCEFNYADYVFTVFFHNGLFITCRLTHPDIQDNSSLSLGALGVVLSCPFTSMQFCHYDMETSPCVAKHFYQMLLEENMLTTPITNIRVFRKQETAAIVLTGANGRFVSLTYFYHHSNYDTLNVEFVQRNQHYNAMQIQML